MLGLVTKNKKVRKFQFVGKEEKVRTVEANDTTDFYRNMLIGYHKGEIFLTDAGLEMIFSHLQDSEDVVDSEMSFITA